MITAMQASCHEGADLEQDLLTIAITAAIIRSRLDQPLCATERAHLAIELEQVEQVRHTLEQHVAALVRSRPSWWRRLLRL